MNCRVCQWISKKNISLSDICIEESVNICYLEAFNSCTKLGATLNDDLPQCLCKQCAKKVKMFYLFLRSAQNANAHWIHMLNPLKSIPLKETINFKSNIVTSLNEENEEENNMIPYKIQQHESKDPLEESEEEEIAFSHQNLMSSLNEFKYSTSNENFDDSDDNTPLKDLFRKDEHLNKFQDNSKIEIGYTRNHRINLNPDENAYDENDYFSTSNAETQLFPPGRHKCKVCKKLYFTMAGLEAHSSLHLPKNDTLKKKRVRGPNKKQQTCLKETIIPDNPPEMSFKKKTSILKTPNKEFTQIEESRTQKQKLLKPKKLFPCQVCGKHMISASKLRYHMVMHTGEKDYLCTMCPKAYSTIYALKHHLRTHTGERPYQCKFCGDKFTRPTTLKSHMRRHTGERPYGCEICGKRFIQHSSMTTHMKLNHMDKTIPCPHCNKKYARQTDLNTHMLSHTGDKPFPCQLCSSRFIRQANLNKHMNQTHANKSKTSTKTNLKKSLILQTKPLNIESIANLDANPPSLTTNNLKNEISESEIMNNVNIVVVTPTVKLNPKVYSNSMPIENIVTEAASAITPQQPFQSSFYIENDR